MVIALEAKKAFDYIEWGYMLTSLKYFGFGHRFIKWIKVICAHPQALIITNGDLSQSFRLHRGVQQGFSCAPYLFNLAIEDLASQIRLNQETAPIKMHGVENKIYLFADDITLFVSRPKSSIPPLLQLIDTFGSFSGLRSIGERVNLCPY